MDCQYPRQPWTTAALLQGASDLHQHHWDMKSCLLQLQRFPNPLQPPGRRTGELRHHYSCTLRPKVISHGGFWRSRISAKGTGKDSRAPWFEPIQDGHLLQLPLQCLHHHLQPQLPPRKVTALHSRQLPQPCILICFSFCFICLIKGNLQRLRCQSLAWRALVFPLLG